MVAADVRNEQRRAERKAVRRDDRDDVQCDDDGVGAHPAQDARTPPLENSPDFARTRPRARRDRGGCSTGAGGCVLVSGPAGIGKTALLGRGRRTSAVLRARGSELERSFAFGGVQQLFARVPVPYSGAAAHAAGAFSAGGEPDHAVLHGLYWLTAGLGPLAIVVDDAHWLDQPSLRWLAYMVNRVADLPLALLLAARSDEQDELLSRIALHPSTTVLRPKPLSRRPRSPSSPARSAPPRSTRPPAASRSSCTRWSRPTTPTPRPVVESIALRLEELPPACLKLARAIAVAGSGGTIAARLAGPRRPRRRDRRRGAGEGRPARRRRLRPPARPAGRLRRDPGGGARRAARRRRRGW